MFTAITAYFFDNEEHSFSVDEFYRARLLISSSIVSAALLLPFALAWAALYQWMSWQFILVVVALLTLFSTPFVFKLSRSITFSGIYLNFISTVLIMTFTYIDGGLYATSIPWVPVLPLFGAFYSGKKYGILVCAILTAFLLVLFYLHSINKVPSTILDEQTFIILYTCSTITAIILLLFVAFSYLSWQGAIREELVKASRAKNEFLSGVSHELRTPLNSILGFSEVLSRGYVGELNEKQVKFVNHINSSGDHLLQLVNDLLDISKIEAGQIGFHPEAVNVHELSLESIAMVKGKAKNKNISLIVQTKELKNVLLTLDRLKIKQVLLNLLSNAIKFTPKDGTVYLTASIQGKNLKLVVEDTGPGISLEHHCSIFERFYQIHQDTDDKDPGTGLGLAISKHYIEMHEGNIYLCNEAQGAKFICELPASSKTLNLSNGPFN